ncbi:hypothetical protein ACLMAJ_23140 [Nocardia sp. KC 131]|uniref:hypothetical protein n=1 Tax=Nocardia arseniciresistens TaxID=3392119 RepID=UPI00398F68C4
MRPSSSIEPGRPIRSLHVHQNIWVPGGEQLYRWGNRDARPEADHYSLAALIEILGATSDLAESAESDGGGAHLREPEPGSRSGRRKSKGCG